MLQASPSDWLSADHQVFFLLDLVDELDLSAIVIPSQSKDPRGEGGFDPWIITLLLLYAYCTGVVSEVAKQAKPSLRSRCRAAAKSSPC